MVKLNTLNNTEKYLTGKELEKKEFEIIRSFLTDEQNEVLSRLLIKAPNGKKVIDTLKIYSAEKEMKLSKALSLYRIEGRGEVRKLYYKMIGVELPTIGGKAPVDEEKVKEAVNMRLSGVSGQDTSKETGVNETVISYAYRAELNRRDVDAALRKFRKKNERLNPNKSTKNVVEKTDKQKNIDKEAVDKACDDFLEGAGTPKTVAAKPQSDVSKAYDNMVESLTGAQNKPKNTIKASKIIQTVEGVQQYMDDRLSTIHKDMLLQFKKLASKENNEESYNGHKVGLDNRGNIVMLNKADLRYDENKIKVNEMLAYVETLEAKLKTSESQYLGALSDSQELDKSYLEAVAQLKRKLEHAQELSVSMGNNSNKEIQSLTKELEETKIKYTALADEEVNLQDFIKNIQGVNSAYVKQVQEFKESGGHLNNSIRRLEENNKMMLKDIEEGKDLEYKLRNQLKLSESNKIQAHKDIDELHTKGKEYKSKISLLGSNLNSTTEELIVVKEERDKLEYYTETYEKELNTLQDRIDNMTEEYNGRENSYIESILAETKAVIELNEELECALKDATEHSAHSESDLRVTRIKIREKQTHIDTLLADIITRDNTIMERDAIIAAKESEIEDLHNVNNSLEEHAAELYNDIEHNSMDYSNLEESYKVLTETYEQREMSLFDSIEHLAESENDLRKSQDKVEELRERADVVESDNIELENHNKIIIKEHSELAMELVDTAQKLDEAEKKILELLDENEDYKNRGFIGRVFGNKK